jgi:hypothetical protein
MLKSMVAGCLVFFISVNMKASSSTRKLKEQHLLCLVVSASITNVDDVKLIGTWGSCGQEWECSS